MDDDDDASPDGGSNNGNNDDQDGGVDNDGGVVEEDGHVGDDGGNTGPGVTSWVVGNWVYDADGEYIGSLTIVEDLSGAATVDLANAEDFGTDITYSSPGGGVVFVGRQDQSDIQRWEVNASGELAMTGEVGLSAYGVTSTLGRSLPVIQFIDDDRAYYVDIENFQVIVFNPSATPMAIYPDDTFSFDELDVEDVTEGIGTIQRDGDHVIVAARYWDEDDTATPLIKLAIIDVKTDTVTYAEDTRCANVGSSVVDDEGNIYFGSHPALGVWNAAGLNDDESPPACIVRVKKGEDAFDPDYFVDLEEISNGGTVGTLMQGVDGHAYVMQYTGEDAITAENWRGVMYGAYWELHLLELDDAAGTYAKVEGMPKGPGYNSSFTTIVGHEEVTYLILPDDEFVGGFYYDVSDPASPKRALEFPGYPGPAIPID